MQIVRAAGPVSRLEATKSAEREIARRVAERPHVTQAIDISSAEKRQAEEAETEEAVPKELELAEEPAQTVPERLADPAYRERYRSTEGRGRRWGRTRVQAGGDSET